MNNNDELERQAFFELWATDNGVYPNVVKRSNYGSGYLYLATQNKWDVWQAAWSARARKESNDE